MALEVADHAVHEQPVVLVHELLGGVTHDGFRDVERDVAAEVAGRGHGIEQYPRLLGRARAELDQLAGPDGARYLIGLRVQDGLLGAGRVVLGQLADALEQLRASGVVEVLGRELLERPREPVEHVVGQHPLLGLGQPGVDPDLVGEEQRSHQSSLAMRKPEKICRRSGKSQLRKHGVMTRARVAQEPPRRTR